MQRIQMYESQYQIAMLNLHFHIVQVTDQTVGTHRDSYTCHIHASLLS